MRRGNFKFYDRYNWYVPGIGQMFILLLMVIVVGAVLGNIVTLVLNWTMGSENAITYSMLVSYPVLFIPAMLYAGIKSRVASYNSDGYRLDNNNFGKIGGVASALLVAVATLALAFCTDPLNAIMPEMPQWLQESMDSLTSEGVLWVNFISVSIFAPFFEEWLCRGTVLRGLLHKGIRPLWAIIISSVFFAVIHLNIWQAIPAFALGCLFGYVYYKTGSLKLTMLMHFANNTFSLIVANIDSLKDYETWMDMLPAPLYWILIAACILLLILIIRMFGRIQTLSPQGSCERVSSLFPDRREG